MDKGGTMKWTTEKPSKDGWYWARGMFRFTTNKSEEVIEIVRVEGDDVYPNGTEINTPIDRYTHWIGPLEVPIFNKMNNAFKPFVDFLKYCSCHGILLTKEQIGIAKDIFDLPVAGGKTTLISLLYGYDPAAHMVKTDLDKRFLEIQKRELKDANPEM